MLKYQEMIAELEENKLTFKGADRAFVELFPLLMQYISLTEEVSDISFDTDYKGILNVYIYADEITAYKDRAWFLLIRNSKKMVIKPTEDGLVFCFEYLVEVK